MDCGFYLAKAQGLFSKNTGTTGLKIGKSRGSLAKYQMKGYLLFSTIDPKLNGYGGSGTQAGRNRGSHGSRPLLVMKLVGEARKTAYSPRFVTGKIQGDRADKEELTKGIFIDRE